jgi:hypothetical protein
MTVLIAPVSNKNVGESGVASGAHPAATTTARKIVLRPNRLKAHVAPVWQSHSWQRAVRLTRDAHCVTIAASVAQVDNHALQVHDCDTSWDQIWIRRKNHREPTILLSITLGNAVGIIPQGGRNGHQPG